MKTCDEAAATSEDLLAQLESKYKERNQDTAWKLECETWKNILATLITDKGGIGFNYRIEKLIGLGGAGAVFRTLLRETLGHEGIREVVLEELNRFTTEE